MSRWGRRRFLLSDECEMKSGKIMALVKGVWALRNTGTGSCFINDLVF